MAKRLQTTAKQAGLAPGTLVHTGLKKKQHVKITLIDYDQNNYQSKQVTATTPLKPFKDSPSVSWINVDGVHQIDLVEKIGRQFNLHPLLLEDVVHTAQRPKVDQYQNQLYVVMEMLTHNPEKNAIAREQLSLILGPNYVITFQEQQGDVLQPIRDRIRNPQSRLRKLGPDYLLYALIDALVDHYFIVLEKLGERIEALQNDIVNKPDDKTVHRIYELKQEMILLRRSCWPVRELLADLQRSESNLITQDTAPFFRDLYDHSIRVIETAETYRDMITSMLDVYLTMVSNKMNEVMKVLTIIATIFIPLTFIAGIYGMNFQHMPELAWPWAYPAVWALMAALTILMLALFRRKHWL